MWNYQLLVLVLLALTSYGEGYKILCVAPFPGRSHALLVENICRGLARKGHDMTFITPHPGKTPTAHLTEISVKEMFDAFAENDFDMFKMRQTPIIVRFPFFMYMATEFMDTFLKQPSVTEFLKSDEQFDLVLTEHFLSESVSAGFAHRFKAPLALISPFQPNLWMNFPVGNPEPPSYIPDTFLVLTDRMTFTERLTNTVFTWINELFYKCLYLPAQDRLMRKYFGDDLPPLKNIIKNTSLILVNHHFSLAFPRPYVPNMVEVAGMHIKPLKPLPKDIQEFMDSAKDGVIYFSLGSNIETSKMPKEQLNAFIKAFSQLKQKILWKWELDEFPNKPDNVKFSSWFPQSDILAHPNLKLFITHNGLSSTIEAVYRGVPTLSVPIFADQLLNAQHIERAGITKIVDFDLITADSLRDDILEVINNKQLKENLARRSALLRDRPLSAMDTAIYWIEYVIRHEGATHIKSAAQDLAWYQLYNYDVYLVILLILYLLVKLNVVVIKKLAGCCRRKPTDLQKKKQ